MSTKTKKALMTLFKYLAWTGIAAVIQAAINYQWNGLLPEWAIMPIAAGLKTLATYWATKKPSYEV